MQTLAELNSSLKTVEKFEELFGSFNATNITEYGRKHGRENLPGTFMHYMVDTSGGMNYEQKIKSAFANFTFSDERQDLVDAIIEKTITIVPKTEENKQKSAIITIKNHPNRAVSLVNLILSAVLTQSNPSERSQLASFFNQLIAKQKQAITKKIKHLKAKNSAKLATAKIKHGRLQNAFAAISNLRAANRTNRKNRYFSAAALAGVGTGAIAFSTLMQFDPQFTMLASLNLPPVALAAVAVSGVAMVAAAAYVAYRTCKSATVVLKDGSEENETLGPVAATNYSKFLPHVLATMGTGMVGFSALMQFSPKVALFMGLNLTPAALMSVAAVGVLLLSASLYLACKAYAKSRVVATADSGVVNADTAVQNKSSCMQRLSQYTACCFKLFKNPYTTTSNNITAQVNTGNAPESMEINR